MRTIAVIVAVLLAGCSSGVDSGSSAPRRSPSTAGEPASASPPQGSPAPPGSPGAPDPTPPPTPGAAPGSPEASPAPTPPPSPAPPISVPETTASFGASTTYSDAVQIALTPPRSFQPGRSALTGGDFPYYVRLTVTVTNGSTGPLRLEDFHVAARSGGNDGVLVVDDTDGLSDPPSTTILAPGEQGSFDVAFGITDPADLTVEAAPSFAAPAVTWSSR